MARRRWQKHLRDREKRPGYALAWPETAKRELVASASEAVAHYHYDLGLTVKGRAIVFAAL